MAIFVRGRSKRNNCIVVTENNIFDIGVSNMTLFVCGDLENAFYCYRGSQKWLSFSKHDEYMARAHKIPYSYGYFMCVRARSAGYNFHPG